MIPALSDLRRPESAALVVFISVQAFAGAFFVFDVISDLREGADRGHMLLEAFVTFALVLAIAFGLRALRSAAARMKAQEMALAVASGALVDVVEAQFADWGLTPAERDVGMLALKGLDVAEIAALRGAAQGTVRAQLTRIYAKAGVSGRAQFAAHFVEDLLGQGLGTVAEG